MPRYEEVELNDLKHGDQIAVMGRAADLLNTQEGRLLLQFMGCINKIYYHHGIFDKTKMEVIDFYGENKANAIPRTRGFIEFFAGHTTLYRVKYMEGEQCLPVSETMAKAEDAVKKASSWPGYNLIENNCESFATYLKTGELISKQALDALAKAVPRVAAAATAGLLSSGAIISAASNMKF